ncbi:MAG TPA: hypothetical protein ACFYD4_11190 [Candidatus Wunengus sp. YC61]|uniref:hypothetical protein n=1 Tax=Candidatus Wunengus sp. YC61 TaxID=3367698 RepID=UPI004028829D
MKHHLKVKYYLRYCDDFVLLDERKERLLEWKENIRDFLNVHLRLALNDRRQAIGPIRNGVDFLGYIVRPDYLLVRRRVVNRFKARLMEYQKKLIVEKPVLMKMGERVTFPVSSTGQGFKVRHFRDGKIEGYLVFLSGSFQDG